MNTKIRNYNYSRVKLGYTVGDLQKSRGALNRHKNSCTTCRYGLECALLKKRENDYSEAISRYQLQKLGTTRLKESL